MRVLFMGREVNAMYLGDIPSYELNRKNSITCMNMYTTFWGCAVYAVTVNEHILVNDNEYSVSFNPYVKGIQFPRKFFWFLYETALKNQFSCGKCNVHNMQNRYWVVCDEEVFKGKGIGFVIEFSGGQVVFDLKDFFSCGNAYDKKCISNIVYFAGKDYFVFGALFLNYVDIEFNYHTNYITLYSNVYIKNESRFLYIRSIFIIECVLMFCMFVYLIGMVFKINK